MRRRRLHALLTAAMLGSCAGGVTGPGEENAIRLLSTYGPTAVGAIRTPWSLRVERLATEARAQRRQIEQEAAR